MGKFWTSNPNSGLISERRQQLELLFAFAKVDLSSKESSLTTRGFIDFLESASVTFVNKRPFVRISDANEQMQGLQEHLRGRFNEIIQNSNHYVEMPLWALHGTLAFKITRGGLRIHQELVWPENPEENELDTLKRFIDWVLIKVMLDLDIEPRRFGLCPRCGAFFYQPTKKEKVYCSIRCGDAARLQKFRKRKEVTKPKSI